MSNGSDGSYEGLCREYYERVVRTAYLMTGDRQDALDIAQETFVRALERWEAVSVMERPGAWLFRVAENLAVSSRRRSLRRLRRVLSPPPVSEPEPPDEELAAALRSLSPAQRSVIVLRFYLDWSTTDVATALGKRPGTVRALTAQGMARLRGVLGEDIDTREDDERPVR